jgi:hypothetical protein
MVQTPGVPPRVELKRIALPSGPIAGSTSCSPSGPSLSCFKSEPSGRTLQIRQSPERSLEKTTSEVADDAGWALAVSPVLSVPMETAMARTVRTNRPDMTDSNHRAGYPE